MKKFNLFNEIITVNTKELLNAINRQKEFGITSQGAIVFAPFAPKEIFIYQGKHAPKQMTALTPSTSPKVEDILGDNYQVVKDGERVLIKAFSNWQELIKINTPHASYDDTTGDGVDKFSNEKLEDLGWHATDFDITYRELVEVLEEQCDGTLLCIEQVEPYQLSGLGFLADDKQAYDVLYNFCQAKIKKMIQEDPLYKPDNLSDDEEEAAEYFACL